MNCKYCGRKIDDNRTFCRFCGCSTEIHNGYVFNSADNFDEWLEGKGTEDIPYRPRYVESNIEPTEINVPKTEELDNPIIDNFMPARDSIPKQNSEAMPQRAYEQIYTKAEAPQMSPTDSYHEHPDMSQEGFKYRMNTRKQVRQAKEKHRLMLTRVVAAAVMLIIFIVIAVFLITTIGKDTEQEKKISNETGTGMPIQTEVSNSASDESPYQAITPKDETETVLESENVSIQNNINPEDIINLSNDESHPGRLIKIDDNYYVNVKSLFNAMTGNNDAYQTEAEDGRIDFILSGQDKNIKLDIINQQLEMSEGSIVFPVTVHIVEYENEDRLIYILLKDFCDNMGYTIINNGSDNI